MASHTNSNQIYWLEPVPRILTSPPQECITASAPSLIINTEWHKRLLALKNEIEHVTPENVWDDAKKLTNLYEYVFLSLKQRSAASVSAIHPLSRSFFKMIEIWDALNLSFPQSQSQPQQSLSVTAHTAEGPGGFMEAIQYRASDNKHNTGIRMVAMTLKSTERTIPGWKKSQALFQKYPQIRVVYGVDGTGNLYSLENQDAFASAVTAEVGAETTIGNIGGTADLYTADGGFDFSADFNSQENTVQRLLIAEALAGLATLKPGGILIQKLFDTTQRATLEFLWVLSSCFEQTGIMKPYTSRPANSERYWIGVGYRGSLNSAWIQTLFRSLVATEAPNGWDRLFAEVDSSETLHVWTPTWEAQIQHIQETIECAQIVAIQQTINLIKKPTRETVMAILTSNIATSRQWCIQHKIPMNPAYKSLTDVQVAMLNLEEALAPFQASVAQTSSQAPFRQQLTHRVWYVPHSPQTPNCLAWRTELPASVLGRSPSRTALETLPCTPSAVVPQGPSQEFRALTI
jgi:23S rRNA U2552 (ribose-2'-O)-methylase RlmE/FtsJ